MRKNLIIIVCLLIYKYQDGISEYDPKLSQKSREARSGQLISKSVEELDLDVLDENLMEVIFTTPENITSKNHLVKNNIFPKPILFEREE